MSEAERRGYVRGMMAAVLAVAEITGNMKIEDFNDKTWSMVCQINVRLFGMAADADVTPQ